MLMRAAMRHVRWAGLAALACAAITLGACGSSSKSSSSTTGAKGSHTLSLSISESGKTAVFTVPSSATGGLVTISLANKGSMPHGAQFVLIKGNHSTQQTLQALGASMKRFESAPARAT